MKHADLEPAILDALRGDGPCTRAELIDRVGKVWPRTRRTMIGQKIQRMIDYERLQRADGDIIHITAVVRENPPVVYEENQPVNLPADFGKDGIDELALRANAHEAAAHAVCRWLADNEGGSSNPELLALLKKWVDTAW